MKENKSPIINLIARKTNKPFNKDLSHLILAILCENRKTIGVFKNMLVSDIRNKIVNSEEEIDLGKTREEQDLRVRIELYKLKNKGYVDFEYYKKDKYSVKSNIKGLEYCKTLLLNLMIDQGINTSNIEVIEDEDFKIAGINNI